MLDSAVRLVGQIDRSYLAIQGPPGSAKRLVPAVERAAGRMAAQLPTGKLAGVQAVSPSVVTATLVSSLEPADAKGHTGAMRRAAGTIPDAHVYLTGQAAIEHDLEPVQNHDLLVGELFIAIPIATLILIYVFGTLAFLLPFMLAAAAIPVTLGFVWIFAHYMTLSTYIQNMVMLIGLGIAIDYTLLMVYRYREEHRAGGSRIEAVERTMDAFQDRWPRWRQLTSTAAHRGMLCFGPDRGRRVTYTNPHRWLPGLRPMDEEAALRTLVTRYLYAYGPATPRRRSTPTR